MMVTRDGPPPGVKPITKGFIGRAVDVVMGRVMDGVCGHGHDEVLMGVKGNGGVVKDRP